MLLHQSHETFNTNDAEFMSLIVDRMQSLLVSTQEYALSLYKTQLRNEEQLLMDYDNFLQELGSLMNQTFPQMQDLITEISTKQLKMIEGLREGFHLPNVGDFVSLFESFIKLSSASDSSSEGSRVPFFNIGFSLKCEKHPSNDVEFFCEDCHLLCCSLCKNSEHDSCRLANDYQSALTSLKSNCPLKETLVSEMNRLKCDLGDLKESSADCWRESLKGTDSESSNLTKILEDGLQSHEKLVSSLVSEEDHKISALHLQSHSSESLLLKTQSLLNYFPLLDVLVSENRTRAAISLYAGIAKHWNSLQGSLNDPTVSSIYDHD